MNNFEAKLEQVNSNIRATAGQLWDEKQAEKIQGRTTMLASSATRYRLRKLLTEKNRLEREIAERKPSYEQQLLASIAERKSEIAEAMESYVSYVKLITESSISVVNSSVIASLDALRKSMQKEHALVVKLDFQLKQLESKLEKHRAKAQGESK